MPKAYVGELAGSFQALERVLADRLEQAVPAPAGVELQERLAHQPVEDVEQVLDVGCDRRSTGEREATGKGGEPAEEPLLTGGEQLVAPVERRPQGALTGDVAGTAGEQRGLVVEPGDELGERERPQPGGGQLDGERDAVEPVADAVDGRPWRGDGSTGGGTGALGEERRGVVAAQPGDPPDLFASNLQRLPAGGEDPSGGARPEQPAHEYSDVVEQVLAVVEHEEKGRRPHQVGDAAHGGEVRTQGLADGGGDQTALGHVGQLDDRHHVDVVGPSGGLERQAGLAGPAGARHRHQTVDVQLLEQVAELALPTHEGGQWGGHPAGDGRPERREVSVKAVGHELPDAGRAVHVTELVTPEVPKRGAAVAHGRPGVVRDEDLAAVPCVAQAGSDVEGHTDRAGGSVFDRPGVDGHACPQWHLVLPLLGGQAPLRIRCRQYRLEGARKDGGDTVTLGSHLAAAVGGDRCAHGPEMPGQGLAVAVAEAAEVPRGVLDVGQQETVGQSPRLGHAGMVGGPSPGATESSGSTDVAVALRAV